MENNRWKTKLELERLYKEFCMSDLNAQALWEDDDQKWINMLVQFVEFRLHVSGGDVHGCSKSMDNVSNFLEEILLILNMMEDWSGAYRGTFCGENYDALEELLEGSSLDKEVKVEILDGFRKMYAMED